MPSPSQSLATLRPDLAGSFMDFNLAMQRMGFIATQAFTVVESAVQAGKFGRVPLKQLLSSGDTARAPGSGYSRGNWTFEPESFATEEHGWEEPIDDRESKMYENYFDAEQVSADRAFNFVLTNAEKRAADKLFNATTFTPTTVAAGWNDATNGTPIADVEASAQRVYAASGLWPNALIISRTVFRNLRQSDNIIQRISSSGAGFPSRTTDITKQQLSECFDLEKILVGGTTENTANEGQAASLASIWSNSFAMVCVVDDSMDIRRPCIGRTIHWGEDGSNIGGTVETYRDETVRGDIARVRHDVDEKLLYEEAADLMDGITV